MIATLLLAVPTPSPSPSDVTIDGTPLGSPGFLGFVFTFALAVAAVFLFLSLTKQMRVVDRRAKAQELEDERRDAEEQAPVRPDPGAVETGAAGPDLDVSPRQTGPDGGPEPDDRPGTGR
ncbi:hypothetical protein [Cellulomonas fengjieae]|uniref:hypothetical protein n=1 Tax=Cellulomonas fengjieae TaxID=2819978 RepID=UPI001AAE61E8|nr:hypothetical protein [Cellulomonas fengjieae]MBO3100495.1 hypothetical protein [Cellulomonas fengjieae]